MSASWVVLAPADEAPAAGWQAQLQALNDKVPEYVGQLGVPVFPEMPLMDFVTDFAVVLAAIALLVAVWRLLTLRIFRSFFAVVAAALILYYPAAYGAHWWLFEYERDAKAERAAEDIPKWERNIRDNLRLVDYAILAGSVVVGGTLLLSSRPRRRRRDGEDEEQVPAEQQEQPPWLPQKKPGGRGSGKDTFDFS